jgi:SOS-response transcriptional repressor LexA
MEIPNISMGERIRQVRRTHGLTQKAFADSLGIAQGFLSSLERGKKTPSATLLIAMTHLYRIDERWLSSGEGEGEVGAGTLPAMDLAPEFSAGKTPLLSRISPGFPQRLNPEDIVGYISLPGNSPDGFALVAYGDFMAPTIQDNDLVFFRLGEEARSGDIVLVNSKWGDIILRRYRTKDDGAWFSPDNSAYTPFQPGSNSRLIGVVTDVWRKVKV